MSTITDNKAIVNLLTDSVNQEIIFKQIKGEMIDDYDYFWLEMGSLQEDVKDNLVDRLKSFNLEAYKELERLIDFSELDVKITEWDFSYNKIKLEYDLPDFDSIWFKIPEYLELKGKEDSNAYRFLSFASEKDWTVEGASLLGSSWISVYAEDFKFDIDSKWLVADIKEAYIGMINDIEEFIKDSIIQSFGGINDYFYSDQRANDIFNSMDYDSQLEVYERGYRAQAV